MVYAGKVDTGFDHARLRSLHASFLERVSKVCPFSNLTMGRSSRFGAGMTITAMREVMWIKPDLVTPRERRGVIDQDVVCFPLPLLKATTKVLIRGGANFGAFLS